MAKKLIDVIREHLGLKRYEEFYQVTPFKPTVGETYWTYTDDWQVKDKIWYGTYIDYCNQKMGCVFRSKAEAVERYSEKSKEIMEHGEADNIAFEDYVK